MTKPSWTEAPNHANFLAQDESGMWVFFEEKPTPYIKDGFWEAVDMNFWEWGAEAENPEWVNTLEKRPLEHQHNPLDIRDSGDWMEDMWAHAWDEDQTWCKKCYHRQCEQVEFKELDPITFCECQADSPEFCPYVQSIISDLEKKAKGKN